MKLIIDIPEEQYNDIVKHLTDNDGNYAYSDFNLREIIRNGTPYNPSGDAISREAVRSKIWKERVDKDEGCNSEYIRGLKTAIGFINNAQAVDLWQMRQEATENALKKAEVLYGRTQGEWIKEPNGKTTDIYRCSICGRSILLCKNADLSKYPFCHCGADMRPKGGKE